MDFFYRIYDLLQDDGFLILEYQPWTSYERAVKNRKQEKIYQNYCQLSIRPEHFESILEDKVGFNIISRAGPTLNDAKGYIRPILIAQKQPLHVNIIRVPNKDATKQQGSGEMRSDVSSRNIGVNKKRNRGDEDMARNTRPKRTNKSTYVQRNNVLGSSFPNRNQGIAAGSWSM